jgi:protein NrfC
VPHRTIWNHKKNVAMKCDLCLDTPFWSETGGPGGKQACVEVCPMDAIAFTTETPNQLDTEGYEVDLKEVA